MEEEDTETVNNQLSLGTSASGNGCLSYMCQSWEPVEKQVSL